MEDNTNRTCMDCFWYDPDGSIWGDPLYLVSDYYHYCLYKEMYVYKNGSCKNILTVTDGKEDNHMVKEKRCYNCMYFNGECGDGDQFCDEIELDVPERYYCYRWREKYEANEEGEV